LKRTREGGFRRTSESSGKEGGIISIEKNRGGHWELEEIKTILCIEQLARKDTLGTQTLHLTRRKSSKGKEMEETDVEHVPNNSEKRD